MPSAGPTKTVRVLPTSRPLLLTPEAANHHRYNPANQGGPENQEVHLRGQRRDRFDQGNRDDHRRPGRPTARQRRRKRPQRAARLRPLRALRRPVVTRVVGAVKGLSPARQACRADADSRASGFGRQPGEVLPDPLPGPECRRRFGFGAASPSRNGRNRRRPMPCNVV
jgi:hypothetical protein